MKPVRVFIVDDSALVRQFIGQVVQGAPGLALAGAAPDPVAALQRMQDDWPDVIVLDIEMPRMDGLAFLRQLMATRPTPVVICSSLAGDGTAVCLDALAAGAVAVFAKSTLGVREHLEQIADRLVAAIREAGAARLPRSGRQAPVDAAAATPAGLVRTTDQIVAIGTSTGGTVALERVLCALPPDVPGLVIVQHMPERFTAAFAERLDARAALHVREARDGDAVLSGRALIAPGGRHMRLARSGGHYVVELDDGPPVNRHRPSVDVLFESVARAARGNALGIILTGMGNDGARGLLAMRHAGASTLAQNEASCVVFGMPKEAIALGAAERVVSLEQVAAEICGWRRRAAA